MRLPAACSAKGARVTRSDAATEAVDGPTPEADPTPAPTPPRCAAPYPFALLSRGVPRELPRVVRKRAGGPVGAAPGASTPRLGAASRSALLRTTGGGSGRDRAQARAPHHTAASRALGSEAPGAGAGSGVAGVGVGAGWGVVRRLASVRWRDRLAATVPTPVRTPFTFCYAIVLIATGLFVAFGDPGAVNGALEQSSSDASNLRHRPVLALLTSGVWVAGGLMSPSIVLFLLVLTALERRVGAWRTAGVFALGHVLATLLTELPVAASVASGYLPPSSLDRLDYGISYGLMASVGALAGLLSRGVRWALLGAVGSMLTLDLIELADPLTNWGHVLALLIGLACWPPLRSRAARGQAAAAAPRAQADAPSAEAGAPGAEAGAPGAEVDGPRAGTDGPRADADSLGASGAPGAS